MNFRGRDYKFAYTVRAHLLMLESKLPSKTEAEKIKFGSQLAVAMSIAHEELEQCDNPDYEPNPLDIKEVLNMKMSDFNRLQKEVGESYDRDSKVTIETEKPRPKKELAPANRSR